MATQISKNANQEAITSLPHDESMASLSPLPSTGQVAPLAANSPSSLAKNLNGTAASTSASQSSVEKTAAANDSVGDLHGNVHADVHADDELEMVHGAQHGFLDPRLEAGGDLMESLESIPNKMAFKIGEAAEMVGVKQYVLRYWESEFEMLRPRKSKNNQRVYSRRDVETALMIKKLLYSDRFSIEGARTALKQLKTQVKEERGVKAMAQSQETAVTKLKGLLTEIRRVREIFC